ncbi:helix-turn-helix transcriptional regulator [Micromonospora sp. CPCC 205539]|uniref:PadR family transcriptional regulator n=1 Tax=Micromonospora sp. CPCC 205539 TaxID=3122408 RepID=UPI002FF38406
MPLNASQNSLVLPLLGLLVEQPSHAYDLTTRLVARYGQVSATRSTVTSLLKSLERAGLVTARVPERSGNRPPRTAYELTEAGVADFRRRVEVGLRDSQAASLDFVMAVAYVGILPAEQAVSTLDARADRIGRELVALEGQPDGVLEVHMLEVAYWRTIVATETTWIRQLASRIRAHDIEWPGTQPDEPERGEA